MTYYLTRIYYVIRVGSEGKRISKSALRNLCKGSKGNSLHCYENCSMDWNYAFHAREVQTHTYKASDTQIQQVTEHTGMFQA